MSDVATDLADPDVLALMRATVGAAGAVGGSACVADRHAQLAAMLERERSRVGSAPDVERTADALLGPLYYRAIFTGGPVDPGSARELVGALLGPEPSRDLVETATPVADETPGPRTPRG